MLPIAIHFSYQKVVVVVVAKRFYLVAMPRSVPPLFYVEQRRAAKLSRDGKMDLIPFLSLSLSLDLCCIFMQQIFFNSPVKIPPSGVRFGISMIARYTPSSPRGPEALIK